MMRGGGVDVTTNRRTRDEGSDKEGEDGKGGGNMMVLAVMNGATLTAYKRSGGSCRVAAAAVGALWQCNRGMVVAAVGVTAAW